MANKKSFRVSKDVKEQILKRIKDEGIPVSQAAEEHGIGSQTIADERSIGKPFLERGCKAQE